MCDDERQAQLERFGGVADQNETSKTFRLIEQDSLAVEDVSIEQGQTRLVERLELGSSLVQQDGVLCGADGSFERGWRDVDELARVHSSRYAGAPSVSYPGRQQGVPAPHRCPGEQNSFGDPIRPVVLAVAVGASLDGLARVQVDLEQRVDVGLTLPLSADVEPALEESERAAVAQPMGCLQWLYRIRTGQGVGGLLVSGRVGSPDARPAMARTIAGPV